MRIPQNVSLSSYIRNLIEEDNLVKFYQTKEWIELRQEVLNDNYYECVECLKKGKYTRANCVHHVNEVRVRPDLALSKYYTNKSGERCENLLPLCNSCHNLIHDKFGTYFSQGKFKNKERW